jgi:tryptophanyl-tRNA synthetase
LVLDDEKSITKKVKSAVTDSGSEVRMADDKPGISNLIEILAVIRGVDHGAIEREFDGQQYGTFKTAVAEAVVDYLRPIRERYEEIRPDEAGLQQTLAEGAERARALASETLRDVRHAMGVGGE